MYEIVMVCTGNICRSPMAERLLIQMLPNDLKARISVKSAGTNALHGHQAADYAVKTMAQIGIDLKDHRACQLTKAMERRADILLAMENRHLEFIKSLHGWGKPKAKRIGEFASGDDSPEIDDPYGLPLEMYQACVDALRPCLQGLVAWLRNEMAPEEPN